MRLLQKVSEKTRNSIKRASRRGCSSFFLLGGGLLLCSGLLSRRSRLLGGRGLARSGFLSGSGLLCGRFLLAGSRLFFLLVLGFVSGVGGNESHQAGSELAEVKLAEQSTDQCCVAGIRGLLIASSE